MIFKEKSDCMISVIMPVYNAVKTIKRSVNSILNQTYSDFEFIIINEALTNDGTTEILEQYAETDSRIRLIQKTNQKKGVAVSLNLGLDVATGKYIARMDADDYSYPERFQKQLEYMESNPDVAICGTQMKVYNSSKFHYSEYYSNPEKNKAFALFDSPVSHPTVFIRRQFLIDNELRYDEECLAEDYDLWIRVLKCGGRIGNLDKALLDYHNEGVSNVTSSGNIPFFQDVTRVKKNQLKDSLGIDIDYETEKILMPVQVDSFSENSADLIIRALDLMDRIEKENEEKKIYEPKALSEVMINRWNMFIKKFYILNGIEDIDSQANLDISLEKDTCKKDSFIGAVSEKIGVSEAELRNHILENINSLKAKANEINRVIVFGTGMVVKRYSSLLAKEIEVVAYSRNGCVDNEEFEGKRVIDPSEITSEEFDHILIGSNVFYEEIKEQLINECGVAERHVLPIEILKFR
ncbi:Glycosyl transferase family 2 [Lachnospiraceae bacterium]|nr:Glycosyl transferase family 2 [Lachnospiraceae bacterium]